MGQIQEAIQLVLLNPFCLLLILMGVVVGIIFGSIPGLSSTMALILFLPMSFGMEPMNGIALHCKRRAAELKGSIAMLEEEGIMSEMTVATKHRLEALEPYNFAEKYVGSKPKDFTEIIEAIRVKK